MDMTADWGEGRWREFALERLPEFADLVIASRSDVDLWQNLKEFLADEGAMAANQDRARAIFEYAWWCITECDDKMVAGQAEVSFYEDLPVYSDFHILVPIYITRSQFSRLEVAFRSSLSDDEYDEFKATYEAAISRHD